MKTLYCFSILSLFLSFGIYAQENQMRLETDSVYLPQDTTHVVTFPEYKGGQEKLFKHIASNFKMSSEAISNRYKGTIYIKFIIEKNGTVEEGEVIRGIHPSIDNEALRVILLADEWQPAIGTNGSPVRCYYSIPVRIK